MAEEWIKGYPGKGTPSTEESSREVPHRAGWDDGEDGGEDRDRGDRYSGSNANEFVSESEQEGDAESGAEEDANNVGSDETRYLLPGLRRIVDGEDNDDDDAQFGTRKVQGSTDDRARVTQVTRFPFSAVCSLQIYKGGRQQIGTGFFVGKNLVMTAGHNLCNNANLGRGYVDKIVVYAARDGQAQFQDREEVTNRSNIKVSRAWRDSRDQLLDWGIIILNKPFGERFGAFSLGSWSPDELKELLFNVVGYPSSKSTISRVPYQLWAHVGKVTWVGQRSLRYEMDTTGGQSGCPVIAWKEPKSFVVGVHNYGYTGYNQATRVTKDIAEAVKAVGGAKFF